MQAEKPPQLPRSVGFLEDCRPACSVPLSTVSPFPLSTVYRLIVSPLPSSALEDDRPAARNIVPPKSSALPPAGVPVGRSPSLRQPYRVAFWERVAARPRSVVCRRRRLEDRRPCASVACSASPMIAAAVIHSENKQNSTRCPYRLQCGERSEKYLLPRRFFQVWAGR